MVDQQFGPHQLWQPWPRDYVGGREGADVTTHTGIQTTEQLVHSEQFIYNLITAWVFELSNKYIPLCLSLMLLGLELS